MAVIDVAIPTSQFANTTIDAGPGDIINIPAGMRGNITINGGPDVTVNILGDPDPGSTFGQLTLGGFGSDIEPTVNIPAGVDFSRYPIDSNGENLTLNVGDGATIAGIDATGMSNTGTLTINAGNDVTVDGSVSNFGADADITFGSGATVTGTFQATQQGDATVDFGDNATFGGNVILSNGSTADVNATFGDGLDLTGQLTAGNGGSEMNIAIGNDATITNTLNLTGSAPTNLTIGDNATLLGNINMASSDDTVVIGDNWDLANINMNLGDDNVTIGQQAVGSGNTLIDGGNPNGADTDGITITPRPDQVAAFESAGWVDNGDGTFSSPPAAFNGGQVTAPGVTVRDFEGAAAPLPNDPPVIDPIADTTIDENSTDPVFTASATDPDGDPVTYSLSGDDAALFNIDPATGVVTPINPLDFETPTDTNGDGIYDITVVATDPEGATAEEPVAITVGDVNEAPVLDPIGAQSTPENSTDPVFTASATDPENDDVTYSLSGDDAALFNIDPATGVVTPINPLDFETPTDGNSDGIYDITVVATDPEGATAEEPVAITVGDVNEAPVLDPIGAQSTPENSTDPVFTASATDPENDDVTYSLSGDDAALFNIDPATGVVTPINPLDFETPTDANSDGIYDITVVATDPEGATAEEPVAITVGDVNEAPDVTGPAAVDAPENATDPIATYATTDPEGDPVTLSLTGPDAALFEIDQATGELSPINPLDFETPTDANGDGVYDVTVVATDAGGLTDEQPVAVTVTDVVEADGVVDGAATGEVMEPGYTDPDGDIIDGADGLNDTIEGNGGDDTIDAGLGDDLVDGGADNDSITGGGGSDTVLGGDGADTLAGGEGDDTLDGGAGDDDIAVGGGDAGLGGSGDDVFTVDPTDTTPDTNVTIDGGTDGTVLGEEAGPENGDAGDVLDLGDQTGDLDVVLGANPESGTVDGIDTIAGDTDITFDEIEKVITGSGDDTVDGSGAGTPIDVATGGGDDSVLGGSGNDSIVAGTGNDTIDGGDGNDTIDGGDDDDLITGGGGDDSIAGGAGTDTLTGGEGADTLDGGAGDDDITVGAGDTALGGDGDDEFFVDPTLAGTDTISITGGEGGEDLTDPTNGGDGDTLDLTNVDIVSITYDETDPTFDPVTGVGESGTIVYNNDAGDPVTITFSEIENVVSDPLPDGVVDGEETGELMGVGYDDSNAPSDGGGDLITNGDDSIEGNGGDDTINAGAGNDTVDGGDDNDSIQAGDGDDSVLGGAGLDTLSGGIGSDTLDGGIGDDVLSGGAGDDSLLGGDGADDITAGSGDDTIDGGLGNDTVDAGTGADEITDLDGDNLINSDNPGSFNPDVGTPIVPADPTAPIPVSPVDSDTTDNADTITTGAGNDTINAGDDADVIDAGDGDNVIDGGTDGDTITTGAGADSIMGGEGNDQIDAGDGNDTIEGGAGTPAVNVIDDPNAGFTADPLPNVNGDDTINAGGGDDVVMGEDDDDLIDGGTGNDTLDGGIDDDTITGGAGDDVIIGGQGADSLDGGLGDDTFDVGTYTDPRGTGEYKEGLDDTIVGGEDGDGADIDVLDLSGSGPLFVDYDETDPTFDPVTGTSESGTVIFYTDDTETTEAGRLTFSEIETVIPCFTPGTMIATSKGEKPVEDLKAGDRVITRDNGFQEIAWVGAKQMTGFEFAQRPEMKPVFVKAGSFGEGLPERDMLLSPNHKVLLASDLAELHFEDREVLVAAKHMVGMEGISRVDVAETSYIHFMFERHEIVLSDGAWSESFHPGDYSINGIDEDARREILALFPELDTTEGLKDYRMARIELKKHEARLLLR